jgi:hypothetical protein
MAEEDSTVSVAVTGRRMQLKNQVRRERGDDECRLPRDARR